jgi:hypothetical protein
LYCASTRPTSSLMIIGQLKAWSFKLFAKKNDAPHLGHCLLRIQLIMPSPCGDKLLRLVVVVVLDAEPTARFRHGATMLRDELVDDA